MSFILDTRLDSSSFFVKDLLLCQVRLKNDRRFPWIILIPRKPGLFEIFDLPSKDQQILWEEVVEWTHTLHQTFNAHKMNIEMVGNKVRQLHIHIIARYESDFAWPESALSAGSALEYTPTEVEEIRVRLLS